MPHVRYSVAHFLMSNLGLLRKIHSIIYKILKWEIMIYRFPVLSDQL